MVRRVVRCHSLTYVVHGWRERERERERERSETTHIPQSQQQQKGAPTFQIPISEIVITFAEREMEF